jgi:flagellin
MALGIGPLTRSNSLDRTQEALKKTFAQLSSLKRITAARDDAAGLAISENLRAAERSFTQGERNLADGISLARTAEGGLSGISDMLVRMRELSVQAGNGALDDSARAAIQTEFDALGAEITRTSEATQFGGRGLLNGEIAGANSVQLRDGTDSGQMLEISVDSASAASLGVQGLDASDPATLDTIDQALGAVSSARGDLGATQNRLESGIRNLQNIRENTAAANSRIADADVAEVAAELTKQQILQQMQISVEVQANISAGLALQLLR